MPNLTLPQRAALLFVSRLQECDHPDAGKVRAAIDFEYEHCGCAKAAADVASAYGHHIDDPTLVTGRMCWCLNAAADAYPAVI